MTTAPSSPQAPHDEEIHPESQADPVPTHLTHLEQYKMLREEIMHNIRVMDTVQYFALIGAGAIYTWLVLNKKYVSSTYVWFVAPALLVFCALKY